ncbi:MAG: DMT family transporter [Alphaproteobacteria bacterium]
MAPPPVHTPPHGTRFLAFWALLAGAVAIGASPIFVRLSELGPFATAFWRVALALPLLAVWAALADHDRRRDAGPGGVAGDIRTVLLPGIMFTGDLVFWHLSILNTSVANATLFANFSPVIVTLGAWVLLGERVTRSFLIGLGVAMAGAVLLLGDSFALKPDHLDGDLYGLVTAFFFGSYVLSVRAVRPRISAARLMLGSSFVTAAGLFLVTLIAGEAILPDTARGWTVLLGLAWVSHAGGQGLLAYALGHLPAGLSALVILIEPVAAAVLGWLILTERIGPWQALGGAIVLAGVWAANRSRRRPDSA